MRLFHHPESDCYWWDTDCFAPLVEDVTDDPAHVAEAMFLGIAPPEPVFKPLPQGRFDLIYADPAWNYVTYSGSGVPARGDQPYETVTLDDLKALPVPSIASRDCALVMWYLGSHLKQAIELAEDGWGFTYSTDLLTWVKTGRHDPNVRPISMGHWSRKQVEQCLLFTRGDPMRYDAGVRQLIEDEEHVIHAPKRDHSRKPDEAYERLERLFGPVRRIELFARQQRAGWAGWGDEYPEGDQYDGL